MSDVKIASPKDIVEVACTTIYAVRVGYITAHAANAVGVLLRVVVETYEKLINRDSASSNTPISVPKVEMTDENFEKLVEEYRRVSGILKQLKAKEVAEMKSFT